MKMNNEQKNKIYGIGDEEEFAEDLQKELFELKRNPNIIEIPDNATNGDMIMALFDVKEVRKYRTRVTAWLSSVNPIDFQLNWWNTPYKKGDNK